MDKDNEIITSSSRENLNGSHTKHVVLEFAVGYDISSTLSIRGVFNLAEHTYASAQISGGIDLKGKDVDTAPNTFGKLRLQWRPNPRLLTELELGKMGNYYTNP